MAGEIHDVVVELVGGIAPSVGDLASLRPSTELMSQDLSLYRLRQAEKGARILNHFGQGAQSVDPSNPDSTVDPTFNKVRALRDAGHTLGGVFIVGCSLGARYAVVLAHRLRQSGIAVHFVGAVDMPLFPFGDQTVNPILGPLRPWPPPFATSIGVAVGTVQGSAFPIRAMTVPSVTGPAVNARLRMNYYQTAGNGVRPRGSKTWKQLASGALGLWQYASNLGAFDEVHGELTGWTNRKLAIPITDKSDAEYHSMGDRMGMAEAGRDIALALGRVWELTAGKT